jgi:hypothetical protein
VFPFGGGGCAKRVLVESGPVKTVADAKAEQKKELNFLEGLPTTRGLEPSEAFCPDAPPEASLVPGESANEGLFRLTDQTYVADHNLGNLGDIAVAYDQAGRTTAYVLADILVPIDPEEITDADDLETLKVASFLVEWAERS